MFEQIKEKLKSMLAEMNKATTVDGTEVEYDGDEIEVGTALKVEDGTYEFDDFTITVKDGVVTEKVEKETSETEEEEEETTSTTEAPAEEEEEETTTTTEAPAEEEEEPTDEIEVIKKDIEDLKTAVEAIRAKLDEIANTPAADTIVEEFEKANEVTDKFNSKLNNALRYAKTLKK